MNKEEIKNLFLAHIVHAVDKKEFIDCSPIQALSDPDLEQQNPAYYNEYVELFKSSTSFTENFVPWGSTEIEDVVTFKTEAETIFASKYDGQYINTFIPNKRRQIKKVEEFFLKNFKKKRGVCIDISGGAGEYSMMLAKYFDIVIQCDLYEPNLIYSNSKHVKLGIENVLLVKLDYLQMPDLSFFEPDLIICFDTLIRGVVHDKKLINNLKKARINKTELYVDFYNEDHNPLNKLLRRGYLKDNYGYTLKMFLKTFWQNHSHKVLKINYSKNVFGLRVINPLQPTFYLINVK